MTDLDQLRAQLAEVTRERDALKKTIREQIAEAEAAEARVAEADAAAQRYSDAMAEAQREAVDCLAREKALEAKLHEVTGYPHARVWTSREKEMRSVLEWLNRKGGLGLDVHERISAVLGLPEPQ